MAVFLRAPASLGVSTLSALLQDAELPAPPAGEFVIDCSNLAFVSPTGMAALLAVVETLFASDPGRSIGFVPSKAKGVNAYMQRMGLFDMLGLEAPAQGRRDLRGELCELRRIDDLDGVQTVVPELLAIAEAQLQLEPGVFDAMQLSLSEVAENTVAHAQTGRPGIVCAQTYGKLREVEFAIVDAGIGILASATRVPDLAQASDAEAIGWAIKLGTTSKTGPHTGYGLFMTRRMIENNRGTMWVYSGSGLVRIRRGKVAPLGANPWRGTIVTLRFRTDRAISVKEVLEQDFGSEDDTGTLWG